MTAAVAARWRRRRRWRRGGGDGGDGGDCADIAEARKTSDERKDDGDGDGGGGGRLSVVVSCDAAGRSAGGCRHHFGALDSRAASVFFFFSFHKRRSLRRSTEKGEV